MKKKQKNKKHSNQCQQTLNAEEKILKGFPHRCTLSSVAPANILNIELQVYIVAQKCKGREVNSPLSSDLCVRHAQNVANGAIC
jgi:hypothetical protein